MHLLDDHDEYGTREPNGLTGLLLEPVGEEVFAFITDLVRSVGTFLYGRRMYETMAVWEIAVRLGKRL